MLLLLIWIICSKPCLLAERPGLWASFVKGRWQLGLEECVGDVLGWPRMSLVAEGSSLPVFWVEQPENDQALPKCLLSTGALSLTRDPSRLEGSHPIGACRSLLVMCAYLVLLFHSPCFCSEIHKCEASFLSNGRRGSCDVYLD